MGTPYTYTQIAALYLLVCKEPLKVCDPVYSCDELLALLGDFKSHVVYTEDSCKIKFTQYFNLYYGTDYDIDKIMDLYKEKCGKVPNICDKQIMITDCAQLEKFLEQFGKDHPNPNGEFGEHCRDAFTALFNAHFGTALTYDDIVNYYEVLCYKYIDVCRSNCDKYHDIISKMPQVFCGELTLPKTAGKQLFVYLFNAELRAEGMVEMSYNSVMRILKDCPNSSDCALMTLDTTTRDINDGEVLQSLKLAYYMMHPEGLPGDCETDFTSWVNLCMGVSLDYEGLQDIYDEALWPGAGRICSPGDDVELVFRDTPQQYSYSGPLLCGLSDPVSPDVPLVTDLCGDLINTALGFAEEQYEYYLDSLRNVFDTAYHNKCLSIGNYETLTATYNTSEYHYTLYYYDQAGNLVKTVPPEGVHKLSGSDLTTVKNYRANVLNGQPEANNRKVPAHTLATNYRYNTLNEVVAQSTPDGGLSKFYYDRLGRLAVSQNAKQAEVTNNVRRYSYTLYDELGRITEVGEKPKESTEPLMSQAISQDVGNLDSWLTTSNTSETKEQITRTVYDEAWEPFCDNSDPANNVLCQQNLRNRVSYTYVKNTDDANYLWDAATFYSYDIHGNVDTLLQDYKTGMGAINCGEGNPSGNRWKKLVYKYDLISGKVNEVAYQPGMPDQFYHRYEYDAENRLVNVKTSKDYIYWENDAGYSYYKHGPLARTVLGEQQVQGIDYAYTLQGWLKGVNSTDIGDGTYDMGGDGKIGGANSLVARDAYSFSLNYFVGDYKQINTTVNAFGVVNNNLPNPTDGVHTGGDLFNGNIRAMLVNIPKLGSAQLYGYRYDQLNRIVAMNTYAGVSTMNNTVINPSAASQDYNERISYDANGNILGYLRNGATAVHGLSMDSLTYKYDYYTSGGMRKTYIPGGVVPGDAARLTNRLNYVKDNAGGSYTEDIKDESPDNYTYDEIGNLTSDAKENISLIEWTVYGKISHIHKTDGTDINYTYDAAGNRITKAVTINNVTKTTYYVRDASGNVMSIYVSGEAATNGGDITQTELHLYGSSRIGIYNVKTDVQCVEPTVEMGRFIRGDKHYEGGNQVGNVNAVVSDKKIGVDANGDGMVDYYNADVVSATDFYPGGFEMPGRKYNAAIGYRYSFNGKEKDNEVVQYDYGFRIYDPRLVRFKSVDPLTKSYPMLTPYQFASNSPIANVDLDGKEAEYYTTTITYTTVHRTGTSGEGGNVTTSTTSSTSVSHEKRNGWLWGLIPNNGPLGTGTLYTVKTQVIDIYENALGLPMPIEIKEEPIVAGRAYKLSASDEKLMNQTIDRPQYTGSFQIMILGSGNGMYPGDQTGDKPNPDAKTVVVDMNEWNEIFEPILIGMDVKSPIGMEPPEFGEILGEHFEQTVDKYKGSLSDRPEIIPAAGQALEPNSTVCSMCKMGPHPQDGIDAYKTNKYGGVTDTLRKNDKTGKIDTIPTKPNTTHQ